MFDQSAGIPSTSAFAIDRVRQIETMRMGEPQVAIRTEHVFHAGVYARTMIVPEMPKGKACLITSTLIRKATLLISHGDALVYVGADEPCRLTGHQVIEAAAGRKTAYVAASGFRLTMIFATSATTVEEAEAEFTDEPGLLLSRRQGGA